LSIHGIKEDFFLIISIIVPFVQQLSLCSYIVYSAYSHLVIQVPMILALQNQCKSHVDGQPRGYCRIFAATVHSVGNGCHPALRIGWLAYIKRAYPAG
jgi:hypothetical protein